MFGLGIQELILIAVIALVVVGPKKLPDLAKTLGKGFRDFQKAADGITNDFKRNIQDEDKPNDEDLKDSLYLKNDNEEPKLFATDEMTDNEKSKQAVTDEIANNKEPEQAVKDEIANNEEPKLFVTDEIANNKEPEQAVTGEIANNEEPKLFVPYEMTDNEKSKQAVTDEIANKS